MSTKALVPLNVLAKGSEPVGQRAGDLYFDTTTLKLRIYDGSLWNDIVGTGGAGQLQINGGTPASFYGGTPNVDGGLPSSTFAGSYTGSYDGGVS
jgi:hypothetical protein